MIDESLLSSLSTSEKEAFKKGLEELLIKLTSSKKSIKTSMNLI